MIFLFFSFLFFFNTVSNVQQPPVKGVFHTLADWSLEVLISQFFFRFFCLFSLLLLCCPSSFVLCACGRTNRRLALTANQELLSDQNIFIDKNSVTSQEPDFGILHLRAPRFFFFSRFFKGPSLCFRSNSVPQTSRTTSPLVSCDAALNVLWMFQSGGRLSGTRRATGSAMCEKKKSVSGETSCACRSSQGLNCWWCAPPQSWPGGGEGQAGVGRVGWGLTQHSCWEEWRSVMMSLPLCYSSLEGDGGVGGRPGVTLVWLHLPPPHPDCALRR